MSKKTCGIYKIDYKDTNIDHGSNGSIHEVFSYYKNGKFIAHREKVCVKFLTSQKNNEKAIARFKREIECLTTLQGQRNIISIYDYNIDESDITQCCLLMKCYDNCKNYFTDSNMELTKKLDFLINLGEAIKNIHKQNITHRDLKPGNLLLDQGTPIICDFGLGYKKGMNHITRPAERIGSRGYMAPECYEDNTKLNASEQNDLYKAMDVFAYTRIIAACIFCNQDLRTLLTLYDIIDDKQIPNGWKYTNEEKHIIFHELSILYERGTKYNYHDRAKIDECITRLQCLKTQIAPLNLKNHQSYSQLYFLNRHHYAQNVTILGFHGLQSIYTELLKIQEILSIPTIQQPITKITSHSASGIVFRIKNTEELLLFPDKLEIYLDANNDYQPKTIKLYTKQIISPEERIEVEEFDQIDPKEVMKKKTLMKNYYDKKAPLILMNLSWPKQSTIK